MTHRQSQGLWVVVNVAWCRRQPVQHRTVFEGTSAQQGHFQCWCALIALSRNETKGKTPTPTLSLESCELWSLFSSRTCSYNEDEKKGSRSSSSLNVHHGFCYPQNKGMVLLKDFPIHFLYACQVSQTNQMLLKADGTAQIASASPFCFLYRWQGDTKWQKAPFAGCLTGRMSYDMGRIARWRLSRSIPVKGACRMKSKNCMVTGLS